VVGGEVGHVPGGKNDVLRLRYFLGPPLHGLLAFVGKPGLALGAIVAVATVGKPALAAAGVADRVSESGVAVFEVGGQIGATGLAELCGDAEFVGRLGCPEFGLGIRGPGGPARGRNV